MEWPQIQTRIASGEDEQTELKSSTDLRAIGRTLSAFANTGGGILVLGVADDGTIVGVVEDAEKLQERLTSFLQTGLSSPVQARLGRQLEQGRWVHWIEVPRQRGFEPIRADGRVWVRRGRASVEPSPTELQELYNLFGYVLTEERAIEGASVSAIDVEVFRAFLTRLGLDLDDSPQPTLDDDLRNRGVVTEIGGELKATLYGVLAFGREPQSFAQTRSFWLECVVYAGLDRADEVLGVAEAKGRVDDQVNRALVWARSLGRRERHAGIEREDIPLVPEPALREALVNAVAHRDYAITGSRILLEVFDDRLAITSPGSLPNSLDPASVMAGGHPRSRNELIANFLFERRLMEGRGRGWPRMRRAMRQHNGSEPELESSRDGGYVRVTFRTSAGPAG